MNNPVMIPHSHSLGLKLAYLGRLWKDRNLKLSNERLCADLGITLDELVEAQNQLHEKTMRVRFGPRKTRYILQSSIVPSKRAPLPDLNAKSRLL